ncbi:hypothetical protein HDU91_002661, partial [Kappamyces sp. JEL0680]
VTSRKLLESIIQSRRLSRGLSTSDALNQPPIIVFTPPKGEKQHASSRKSLIPVRTKRALDTGSQPQKTTGTKKRKTVALQSRN